MTERSFPADDQDAAKQMLLLDEESNVAKGLPYDDRTSGRVILSTGGNPTIGIGHNLNGRPLSPEEINIIFKYDYFAALETCNRHFPKYTQFTQPRRMAVFNMVFNLGDRIKTFRKMIIAINDHGDWLGAAREAQSSWWFVAVKERGHRVVSMMQTNQIHPSYYL